MRLTSEVVGLHEVWRTNSYNYLTTRPKFWYLTSRRMKLLTAQKDTLYETGAMLNHGFLPLKNLGIFFFQKTFLMVA